MTATINIIRNLFKSKTYDLILGWSVALLLLISNSEVLLSQPYSNIEFQHIGEKNSIGQNTVNCITQDKDGFIWVGTQQGLVRLGNEWGHKRYHLSNSSIVGNLIKTILYDGNANLWVGTDIGLCKYNIDVNSFDLSLSRDTLLHKEPVNALFQDTRKRIWVGLDTALVYIQNDDETDEILAGHRVNSISEFDSSQILVATNKGLYLVRLNFDNKPNYNLIDTLDAHALHKAMDGTILVGANRNSGTDSLYHLDKSELKLVPKYSVNFESSISTISQDLNGFIWVGTQDGIYIFNDPSNPDSLYLDKVENNICNPRSIRNNDVQVIFRDWEGVMWVGTFAGGVSRFDGRRNVINSFFKSNESDDNECECFGNKFIWSILRDSNGDIWLGTRYDGLIKYDYLESKFDQIEPKHFGNIETGDIHSIIEDANKNIWIGTKNGVFKKKSGQEEFKHINPYNTIVLHEGLENDIWLGTRNKGLIRMDALTERELVVYNTSHDLTANFIYSLYVDQDSSIWVGTYKGGLNKIKRPYKLNDIISNPVKKDSAESISTSAKILSMNSNGDSRRILWVGTSGDGLFAIDKKNNTYIDSLRFKVEKSKNGKYGLQSNAIYGIIPDSLNYLWLHTASGLALIDYSQPVKSRQVKIFTEDDGLCNLEGNAGAYFKDDLHNCIYVGGISGFNEIDLNNAYLRDTSFYARTYIDKIFISDQILNCEVGKKMSNTEFLLQKSPMQLKEQPVRTQDLPIEFEFHTLNYNNDRNSQFLVEVFKDGEEKRVSRKFLSANRFKITENNIYDWGTGDFTIKYHSPFAFSVEGLHETASNELQLTVTQSFWKSFHFFIKRYKYGLLLILLGILVYLFLWFRKKRNNRIAEKKVAERRKQKIAYQKEEQKKLEEKVKERTSEIEEKNILLEDQARLLQNETLLLEKQTSLLGKQTVQLRELPNFINDVSRADSIDEICQITCLHLVNHFGFDYVALTLGDYFVNRVKIEKIVIDPEQSNRLESLKNKIDNWKINSEFPFDHHDILSIIFTDNIPKQFTQEVSNESTLIHHVNGPIFNGQKVDFNSKTSPLNKKIYEQNEHHKLNRYFMSITQKRKEQSGNDNLEFPLGVIEAGYYERPNRNLEEFAKARLKIFVDNIAQPYLTTYQRGLTNHMDDIALECGKEKTYQDTFEKLVENIVKITDSDRGFLGYLSLNEMRYYLGENDPALVNFNNLIEVKHLRELIDRNHENKSGLIWEAIKNTEPQLKQNCNIDLAANNYRSYLVLPLIYEGKVIGAIGILSEKSAHFNKYILSFLNRLVTKVVELGFRQKLLSLTSDLISPFNLYTSREGTYQTLINKIEKRLFFNTVGIWEIIDRSENKIRWNFIKGSDDLMSIPEVWEEDFLDRTVLREISHTQVIPVESMRSKNLNKNFNIKKHYKSIICTPLKIDRRQEGQIVIFSKRSDLQLFSEDRIILDNIASKAAITILSQELFETFKHFSEDNNRKVGSPETVLNDLIEVVRRELHASQVNLFWKDKINISTNKYNILNAGKPKFPLTINENTITTKPGDLFNIILKIKEKPILINNKKEFHDKLNSKRKWQSDKYDDSYFIREELEASAILTLGDNSGILFVNFITKKHFDDLFIKRLEALGFLVTNSIRQFDMNLELEQLKQNTTNILKEAQDSTLASEIAHNSGNLVTNIVLRLASMKDDLNKYKNQVDKMRVQEFIDAIDPPISQLNQDFNRLKAYRSTIDDPIEEIDLHTIVDNSLDLLKYTLEKRTKIKVDFKKDSKLNPIITCKAKRIYSVIINLIYNSLEAIPQKNKGTITIRTNKSNEFAIIRIMDDGPGVPVELNAFIFSSDFSTKEYGTGIGLSSSRYIIEGEHHGKLDIGYENRKGATFIIKLPLKTKSE